MSDAYQAQKTVLIQKQSKRRTIDFNTHVRKEGGREGEREKGRKEDPYI